MARSQKFRAQGFPTIVNTNSCVIEQDVVVMENKGFRKNFPGIKPYSQVGPYKLGQELDVGSQWWWLDRGKRELGEGACSNEKIQLNINICL
jgi:hypothetical protein